MTPVWPWYHFGSADPCKNVTVGEEACRRCRNKTGRPGYQRRAGLEGRRLSKETVIEIGVWEAPTLEAT